MTALRLRPNLATIDADTPFLDSLAAWWMARTSPSEMPLALADGIFIVPTRRAARSFADALLRQAGGRPLLLPRIVALGSLDEAPLTMDGALDVLPAVPPARRLAVLTRFILAMNGKNGAPREADRAWTLAVELAALLDEAARAEIDLAAALPGVVGEDFATHWKVTLEFLDVVTRAWPGWLNAEGFTDLAARQTALLNAQECAWRAMPPDMPVIAAGSTGAIPAVGRLLRLVAHLPQGMVVLPGLDRDLDSASWDALDASHPQASLRQLLVTLDARREDVQPWSDVAAISIEATCQHGRIETWRTAMLPAASLGIWQTPPPMDTTGLQRLEPGDQQEEALAIALVLRGALETPHARAALVTPDRQLATRVGAELQRFGVVADDSAGEPLADTPPAIFLRLLAEAVAEELRPVPLLSLLKHPFCAAGLSTYACRNAARTFERACLRGARPGPGIDGLRARRGDASFLDRVAKCLHPLLALADEPNIAPDRAFTALLEAAEALASTDDIPGAKRLWAGEDGDALAQHLASLRDALPLLPPQPFASLPLLLGATLAGAVVRSRRSLRGRDGHEHPRVFIWGLLEARLQSVDVIVLGGLSEGVWPQTSETGPWMNRAMRVKAGLPSPEEQVGLAAHDFVSASCAAPIAILSAPRRREGAPAIPSRWLVRLDALLDGQRARLTRHPAPSWARALDRPAGPPQPVSPPAPSPPAALRPRRLSVTEIETWLRDPYAIYAKHVLRIRKIDPLEDSADAADYGTIVHSGLNRFFERTGVAWPANALEQITADMDLALDEAGMRPALAAWWRPRLRRIAAWVTEAERDRRARNRPALLCSERKGDWHFETQAGPFVLHGRADRIERRADGSIAVLDYKTGTPPSTKDVEDGRSPQLPLEAAMVHRGAFGPDLTGEVAELVYWQISGGFTPGRALALFRGDPAKTAEMANLAQASLLALVEAFDDPGRAYLSQPSPGAVPRFSDYAHLARVAEWAAAEDTE